MISTEKAQEQARKVYDRLRAQGRPQADAVRDAEAWVYGNYGVVITLVISEPRTTSDSQAVRDLRDILGRNPNVRVDVDRTGVTASGGSIFDPDSFGAAFTVAFDAMNNLRRASERAQSAPRTVYCSCGRWSVNRQCLMHGERAETERMREYLDAEYLDIAVKRIGALTLPLPMGV